MIIYDKNNIERCEIKSLEYSGEFMGERFLSVNIKSSFPIDFALGDYIDYRGERFTLNYDPSIIKKAEIHKSGEAFTYENVKFNSYADELLRCEFLDYVLNDNLIHFSSLPTFGFHALTIQDLADRIKANLDRVYPGLWTINVDSDVEVKNVFISADKLTVWGALALVSTVFKSNFIIRGRTITIGTAGNVIDNVFEYGKGKGLNKITKVADSEQQIITRLRVYGSTRNLPLRYYNKLTSPLPSNMAVQNLMLPSFPYSNLDPYLDSPNIGELGVMEGSVFFDGSNDLPEIYPSLEGMTASELISAGIPVDLDSGDNGNLDEIVSITNEDDTPITDDGLFEEGETVPPFKLTIKDIGFDINDYLSGEIATISLKTGMNGGREFEILSCEKVGNKYVLTCNRTEDIGRFFPYSSMNIKPKDKFVLLNIEMPEVYIQAASQRLLEAGQAYLSKNDYVRYTYQVNISPVYMARNPIDLIEGDYLLFTDTDLGISGSIIIDTLRIKDDGAPTYEVTLTEEKQVGTLQKLQNQINYLLSGSGGSVDLKQTESLIKLIGSKQFLSRVNPDTANKIITFLEGLEVGTFAPGALGSGAAIKMLNGTSYAEVDNLTVRQKATFRELIIESLKHIGGQLVLTPARMKCVRVVDGGTFYKCYFDTGDGEVTNEFVAGDFARCQVFAGSGTKFYWRLVTLVGDDWINLSKTTAAVGSDAPEAGDDIAQLGNATDTTRQSAIILSTVGIDAPSWKQYSGINSFSLEGKDTTVFSKLGNKIEGKTVFKSDGKNLEEVLDEVEEKVNNTRVGVANLLRNTGFLGDFQPLNVDYLTALENSSPIDTNSLEFWTHSNTSVIDAPSRSGKGIRIGSIQQNVEFKAGEPYVLSFWARGISLTVELVDTIEIPLTSEYKRYSFDIIASETKEYIFILTDNGNTAEVYEIMLSNGNAKVSYSYAEEDDVKAISQIQAINTIMNAIKTGKTEILGGLILSTMIQLGKYKDDVMERVTSGINGIYNNDDDPAIWAGGSFEDAIRTVQKFIDNPNIEPSAAEWEEMANIVLTHGGDGFFRGYIYALGGFFRGRIESNAAGNKIIIDPQNRMLSLLNDDGKPVTELSFTPLGTGLIRTLEYHANGNRKNELMLTSSDGISMKSFDETTGAITSQIRYTAAGAIQNANLINLTDEAANAALASGEFYRTGNIVKVKI